MQAASLRWSSLSDTLIAFMPSCDFELKVSTTEFAFIEFKDMSPIEEEDTRISPSEEFCL